MGKSLKILFLTDNYPPEPNACASRVYERAAYWTRWGHDVTILTSVPNKPEGRVYPGYKNKWFQQEVDKNGIRVIRVKTFIASNQGKVTALRLIDFLSYMVTSSLFGSFLRKPDVIVATSPQFFTAVSGWALSFLKRVPFVVEVADIWPEAIAAVGGLTSNSAYKLSEALELFIYRRANKIILLSEAYTPSLTSRGVPKEKTSVILNGVDLERFRPQSKDPELLSKYNLHGRFVVGYFGTISVSHSVETAASAATYLRDLPITVLIVGGGPSIVTIERIVRENNLDNVVVTGRQPKELMPKFWSVLDVALVHLRDLPVFKTSIPSKMFESMGCGKPILVGVPEGQATKIIRETNAGLAVPPESPEEMARAIRKLYKDRSLLDKLAENSLSAAPHYSRETQAQKVMTLMENVVAS